MPAPLLPKSAAPNNWLSTAISGTTLNGGAATRDQLAANSTNITLAGGALDDTYIAYDPSTKIVEVAGGGVDTVQTWGSGYTLSANVENLSLMGTANSYATGNSGNNILTGNSGNNVIVTGGGSDVLVGSGGADSYIPTKEANSITWISNFKASGATIDKVDVRGFGLSGFSSIQSRMSQIGTDVQIDLGNGQKVMLENKTTSELTAANFTVEAASATPTPTPAPAVPAPALPAPNAALPASDLVMTFADEFDALNLYSTWKPTDGWGNRTLIGNKELELYVDPQYKGLGINPFSVQNGILTITAAKADPALVSQLGGYQYTSGMLSSHASFAQQYGYFEMRAQMTTEQGMWPAFWMLATDGTWPPELDVVEVVGSNPKGVVQSVHTKTGTNSGKTTYATDDLANGFHTYGMDWTASTITFYFDGQKTHQVATPADMNKPMYMMVNLAVGGTWPGSPDGTTDWSQSNLKVDYIRAYKHDANAVPTPVPTPTPTPVPSGPTPAPNTMPDMIGFWAVINHNDHALDLTNSFLAQRTALNTSTTYSGTQMNIPGVAASSSVTVAYDGSSGIAVTNNSAWGAVKNATIKTDLSGRVTINNFVDAEVSLGNGINTVTVNNAKRGTISTGANDDIINVTASSDGATDNLVKINAGNGNNTVNVTGGANTQTLITTGTGLDKISVSGEVAGTVDAGDGDDAVTFSGSASGTGNGGVGNDTITVSGQASGTFTGSNGDDRMVVSSAGVVSVAGGAGKDTFEFASGVRATITDFNASEDKFVLNGVPANGAQVKSVNGSTIVDLGNGSSVTLAGVTVSAQALGISVPAPMPPVVLPNFQATLSHAMNQLDLTSNYKAAVTGANTSTTYTAAQLAVKGIAATANVTVAYDANGITVANNAAWGAIKNTTIKSADSGSVTVKNFVAAEIALGNGDNTVTVTDSKRGSITTGAGNDTINVVAKSDTNDINQMKINAGDGNNTVSFSGALNTKIAATTGAGADSITVSGQTSGSVNAGAGNDRIVTATSGAMALSGGAGKDVFEFIRSAHATISDFNASEDSIVIRGGSTSNVQVKAGAGFTLVDFGNGASVTLTGVSVPGTSINIAYA